MIKKHKTPKQDKYPASQYLLDTCKDMAVRLEDVLDHERIARKVEMRSRVAKHMYHIGGYSYEEIAACMNRHHASIQCLVKDEYRAKKKAYARKYMQKLQGLVTV
jgi:DNA-directed RNA polymerase specialized sigma24 family protein